MHNISISFLASKVMHHYIMCTNSGTGNDTKNPDSLHIETMMTLFPAT